MQHLDRLGLAQRIVLVVGLGLGLLALGGYLMSLDQAANVGWFGYAPLSTNVFTPEGAGPAAWEQLLIWAGLIAVWTVASIVIFKRPSPDRS